MNLQDNDLINGINRGNKKAFDTIFKKYYSGLCTYANDYLGSKDAAEEITQEIFLNLWENRKKIKINSSLKSYLYRSVYNRCMNYIRDVVSNSHKNIQIEQVYNHTELNLHYIPETIFDELFSEEIKQKLISAIESLPPQCKTIFCMNRFDGFSYCEIGEQLKISQSTIKTQMSRAVKKLSEDMSQYLKK